MSLSRLAQMAREREDDRKAGRPERGLFTGRGDESSRSRHRNSEPSRRHAIDDDDARDDEIFDDRDEDDFDDRPSRRPRRGARRTVFRAIRQIPTYLRLLIGLIGDSRVSKIDRFLVLATVAYVLSPLDFIPDVIPFFGQVDDMFLVIMSLQRLVRNSGLRVLRAHWYGDPRELSDLNLAAILSAAGFFLPSQLRRRLKRMAQKDR